MNPQEKSEAVARGLGEAFGVTEVEDIRKMTKGHGSALVLRIVVRGSPFLLRIIVRPNAILGHNREFTCMKLAAESGVAPHVWYASEEDGISITGFVEEAPFPAEEALVRIPDTLRTLHALTPFPPGVDYLDTSCMFLLHKGAAVEGFIEKFRAAGILTKEEDEQLFAWRAQVAAVYACHERDMVSSHNDVFKPDNILFDGRRVWLVDWEAAFLNDRYADLAVAANLVVTTDAEELVYLQQYFGQPPDEYQRARFFLMQQIAHMFYTMAFLFLGLSGEPGKVVMKAPEFKDFHRRMWAGEVDLSDRETKILYGRAHWEQLTKNMLGTRWNESLRIVADRGGYTA